VYKDNPEINQDRVKDTFDLFEQYGFVIFPQNKKVYENIGFYLLDKKGTVLEAGCGIGIGSYIMQKYSGSKLFTATDKLKKNIDFGKAIYPTGIDFGVWDITSGPYSHILDSGPNEGHDIGKSTFVVCVETIEHIIDVKSAIKNLIASAYKEVWISTPNKLRNNPPEETPSNPFHVHEFFSEEMLELLKGYKVEILHWETFEKLDTDTKVNPLVYHVVL